MARVSFSALIEEITGKLAGSVFQDSYGGMQIRTRVSPRNPQTNYQQLRRGEFGYISSLWRTLTSVQRQTFIDAAITPPAALNLFITANVNLSLINEAIISTYVPSSDPGTMDISFVDVTPSIMTIQATGATTTVPAGTKLLVQVTYQKAPTKIFTNPSQYSPVISFDEGTDLSIPTDIFVEWTGRYGVLKADMRQCLKANLIDKSNGLRGADVTTCIISEAMPNKYIPLANFPTNVSNTTSSSEEMNTYSMPANTLLTAGDRIIVKFYYQRSGSGGFRPINIRVGGNDNGTFSIGDSTAGEITFYMQLNSGGTFNIYTTLFNNGSTTSPNNGSVPITPSSINDISIVFGATAASQLTIINQTIDLIKAA